MFSGVRIETHALESEVLMVVHEFIRARQRRLAMPRQPSSIRRADSRLARVPLDVFREGSALRPPRDGRRSGRHARMCFPDHPVVRELEQLVGRAQPPDQTGRCEVKAAGRSSGERPGPCAWPRSGPPDPVGHGDFLGQLDPGIFPYLETRC